MPVPSQFNINVGGRNVKRKFSLVVVYKELRPVAELEKKSSWGGLAQLVAELVNLHAYGHFLSTSTTYMSIVNNIRKEGKMHNLENISSCNI